MCPSASPLDPPMIFVIRVLELVLHYKCIIITITIVVITLTKIDFYETEI